MSECAVQELTPRTYAVVSRDAPYEQVPAAIAALEQWLAERNVTGRGEPTVVYLSGPNYPPMPPEHSWEIRIPIDTTDDVPPDEHDVAIRNIPSELVAVTVHRGSYEQLGDAYRRLRAWIDAHEAEISGPPMETRLTDPIAAAEPGGLTRVMIPIYERP